MKKLFVIIVILLCSCSSIMNDTLRKIKIDEVRQDKIKYETQQHEFNEISRVAFVVSLSKEQFNRMIRLESRTIVTSRNIKIDFNNKKQVIFVKFIKVKNKNTRNMIYDFLTIFTNNPPVLRINESTLVYYMSKNMFNFFKRSNAVAGFHVNKYFDKFSKDTFELYKLYSIYKEQKLEIYDKNIEKVRLFALQVYPFFDINVIFNKLNKMKGIRFHSSFYSNDWKIKREIKVYCHPKYLKQLAEMEEIHLITY